MGPALPPGGRAGVLADRGFARATFLAWLQAHHVDSVVRIDQGTCLTEPEGRCGKLGTEGLQRGELRWAAPVRSGLYPGRPRDLGVQVARCWRLPQAVARNPRRKPPQAPWSLATSLAAPETAVAWYWQRGWIEQSFKDAKQGFGLARVQVGSPARLPRLLMALTLALPWLTLAALPECGGRGLRAAAARLTQWGRLSLLSLGLARLDGLQTLPLACLPRPSMLGG